MLKIIKGKLSGQSYLPFTRLNLTIKTFDLSDNNMGRFERIGVRWKFEDGDYGLRGLHPAGHGMSSRMKSYSVMSGRNQLFQRYQEKCMPC
jgi:hypothetical protein